MDLFDAETIDRSLRQLEPDLMSSQRAALSRLLERIALRSPKVVVLGDAMLDVYVRGAVDRISPEAPVPVIRHQDTTYVAGGAANVAVNVAALGGRATFISAVGTDNHGAELEKLLKSANVNCRFLRHVGFSTTTKTRLLAGQHQLIRLDHESLHPWEQAGLQTTMQLLLEEELCETDALVLSDYNKGLLTAPLLQQAIDKARQRGIPILVDPKKADFSVYCGATVIKPNREELSRASGLPTESDADAEAAARVALSQTNASIVLTRSEKGMSLFEKGRKPVHIPTLSKQVFDVSGAGDTAIAAMSLAVASGALLPDAMTFANAAAGLAVSKVGTATVLLNELRSSYLLAESTREAVVIMSSVDAGAIAEKWRSGGLKVGFTNGCFDLLHPGHIATLRRAADLCDRLIVGVNSDRSVRGLKGSSRPIQNEFARAAVLRAIRGVSCVVVFDDDTPLTLIQAIRPDVLIKGADYSAEQVVGYDFVTSYGGRCELVDVIAGHSTTGIIRQSQLQDITQQQQPS